MNYRKAKKVYEIMKSIDSLKTSMTQLKWYYVAGYSEYYDSCIKEHKRRLRNLYILLREVK